MTKYIHTISLLFLIGLTSSNTLSAQLKPSPNFLVFTQRMGNNLEYAILPNDGPANTASIRLYVGVGSLNEWDGERGYAHFVEHMAFNGSDAFPEGKLVETLQNAGIAFGAHANASTDFQRTIYSIELPNVDPETIDLALTALRETAGNLSFTEEAVEREKGVVISELKTRNGKRLQTVREQIRFWSPTSRANERFAIGTKATIEAATADSLRRFYREFYRPENAFLVFVGDVEVEDIENKIQTVFGDWSNNKPKRDLSYMDERLDTADTEDYVFFQQDGASTSLTMTVSAPYDDRPDSVNKRYDLIRQTLANRMFMQRIDKLARADNSPITGARVNRSSLFNEAMLSNFVVSTSDNTIFEAASLMEQELRRAITHGFAEAEVEEQKANLLLAYKYAADSSDKRPNDRLANAIVSAHHTETAFMHPEDELELYEDLAPSLNVQTLNTIFDELWNGQARFFAVVDSPINDAEIKLAATLQQSRQVAVAAPEQKALSGFAYTDFGDAGKVVFRKQNQELDFVKVIFSNNLKVNLKPTDLEDNTVRMMLQLGGGLASIPVEFAGIQNLANFGLINGGLGKHEVTDLPRLLAGRTASVRMQTGNDAYSFPAAVIPEDITLQLKLWAAYLTDAAFRDSAHGQYARAMDSYFQSFKSSPAQVMTANIGKYLYRDPRFWLQPLDKLKSYSMQDFKTIMQDALAQGALELTVVGDFDIDDTIDKISRTLGALPDRRIAPRLDPAIRQISFPENQSEITLEHSGGVDQAELYMYWPTVGPQDNALNAKLLLVREMLKVMITETLREDEGLSYSPSVTKYTPSLFDDFGYISIQSDIGPDELAQAKQTFQNTVQKLVSGDFDESVIERARKPLLTNLERQKKNNQNWVYTLQSAQTNPEYTTYFAALPELLSRLSKQDIVEVAERFLSVEPSVTVQVLHEDVAPKEVAMFRAAE